MPKGIDQFHSSLKKDLLGHSKYPNLSQIRRICELKVKINGGFKRCGKLELVKMEEANKKIIGIKNNKKFCLFADHLEISKRYCLPRFDCNINDRGI